MPSNPTDEHLLLSIDQVTESYPDQPETVNGKLVLYLVPVSTGPNGEQLTEGKKDIYLNATLPSGKTITLSGNTMVQRNTDTSFTIEADKLNDGTVQFELFDEKNAPSRSKEQIVDEADSLDAILAQFCSLPHKNEINSLVLVDSKTGSELGSLQGMTISPSANLPEDKSPVDVIIDTETDQVKVEPHTVVEYEKDDYILSSASSLSNGLIFVSNKVSSGLESVANWWVENRPASDKPLVFSESTKKNVERLSNVTATGASYSRRAVIAVSDAAASLANRLMSNDKPEGSEPPEKNADAPIKAPDGLLNRSLIAFSTVMDGLDTATQNFLQGASSTSTRVIGHSYGPEAEALAEKFSRTVTNCTVVYIDTRGIYRKAIIKGLGKSLFNGVVGDDKVILIQQQEPLEETDRDAMRMSFIEKFVSRYPTSKTDVPSQNPEVPVAKPVEGYPLADNKIQM